MNIVYYIAAILGFTIFDIVGYYYILTKKETIKPKKKWLVLYRILQGAFYLTVIYFTYTISILVSISFVLSHWFGTCDMLYYVLLRQNVWNWKGMFWLWWSPYGLAGEIYDYEATGKQLYIYSFIAIIISVVLCLI